MAHSSQPKSRSRASSFMLRSLLLAFVLIALAGFVWLDNSLNRGISYQASPPPIPWADVPQLGVNAYNIQFEPDAANVTRTLEMARDMGAHYVRMQMPWEDVEIHAKGDFEDRRNPDHIRSAWEKYDLIFTEMQRLGLEPIVRIDRPPRWARAKADATERFQAGLAELGSSTGPPDSYADYADFVAAVATRYANKVRFIQIWNEPNLAYEWNWLLPEPERFSELLKLASDAARRANPNVVILFPSLSPTDGLEPRIAPMSELEYLDRVYKAGGAAYFDIMSAQAYGLGQPPDEHRYVRPRPLVKRPIDTRIDVSRVVLLHEVMLHNGDSQKAVWISEFGYVTAPDDLPHSWGRSVSEEQRAAYLVGQLERARREWPWLGVMNVWMLRWGGDAPDPHNPTAYFAIVGHDFSPSPAYSALQQYSTAGAIAGPGAHSWQHPAVQQIDSQYYELRFIGQSLQIRPVAPISVSIDAQPVQTYNPSPDSSFISVAQGLNDGEHRAVIETAQPPQSFLVSRERPLPWLWSIVPLLLLVVLSWACRPKALFSFLAKERTPNA